MSTPFIRLPVAAAGVAKLNPLDIQDYFISSVETLANAQWSLASGKYSLSSIVDSSDILQPLSGTVVTWTDKSMVTTSGLNKGLKSGINGSEFTGGYTVCAVVKVTPVASTSSIFGDYQSKSSTGVSFEMTPTTSLLYLGKGSVGDELFLITTPATVVNEWMFVAYSIGNTASKATTRFLGAAASKSPVFLQATSADNAYIPSESGIGIGATGGRNTAAAGIEMAEFIILPSMKTEAEMNAIYVRAKERMKLKNIAI